MEYLDIVDEKGIPTGKIENRSIIHDKLLLHNEMWLFIFNSKNETLIQKRSSTKKSNPNKWAICAGHIDVNEPIINACIREAKEELGVDISIENVILFDKELVQEESNHHIAHKYYVF